MYISELEVGVLSSVVMYTIIGAVFRRTKMGLTEQIQQWVRVICKIPCSGQAQCTSRRDFARFSSSTHKAFHGERADKNDCGGLGDGCEIRNTTQHKLY